MISRVKIAWAFLIIYFLACSSYLVWDFEASYGDPTSYEPVRALASPDGRHRLLVQKVYLNGFPGGILEDWTDLDLEDADGSGRSLVLHSSSDLKSVAWTDASHVRVVLDNETILHDRKDKIGAISFSYSFEPDDPAARRARLEKLKIPKELWRENGIEP